MKDSRHRRPARQETRPGEETPRTQISFTGSGLGLRFEEAPASTIIPPHRNLRLRHGMTVTIGHTILAIPGFGGVRHEDVYRVTPAGGILAPYPIAPVVVA
jgi:Xaa-Pro aminopeptidase